MMDLYITRLVLRLGGATITPLFLAIAVDDNNHESANVRREKVEGRYDRESEHSTIDTER